MAGPHSQWTRLKAACRRQDAEEALWALGSLELELRRWFDLLQKNSVLPTHIPVNPTTPRKARPVHPASAEEKKRLPQSPRRPNVHRSATSSDWRTIPGVGNRDFPLLPPAPSSPRKGHVPERFLVRSEREREQILLTQSLWANRLLTARADVARLCANQRAAEHARFQQGCALPVEKEYLQIAKKQLRGRHWWEELPPSNFPQNGLQQISSPLPEGGQCADSAAISADELSSLEQVLQEAEGLKIEARIIPGHCLKFSDDPSIDTPSPAATPTWQSPDPTPIRPLAIGPAACSSGSSPRAGRSTPTRPASAPRAGSRSRPSSAADVSQQRQGQWVAEMQRKVEDYRAAGEQLLQAATCGDLGLCKKLLKSGASMVERTGAGETAMLIVARMGRTEICQELIAARGNVNDMDTLHRTPAELASRAGFTDLAKLLVDSGGFVGCLSAEAKASFWSEDSRSGKNSSKEDSNSGSKEAIISKEDELNKEAKSSGAWNETGSTAATLTASSPR